LSTNYITLLLFALLLEFFYICINTTQMKKIENLHIYADKISYFEKNTQKSITLKKHMRNSEFNVHHYNDLGIEEYYSILCIGYSEFKRKQYTFYIKKGDRSIYIKDEN